MSNIYKGRIEDYKGRVLYPKTSLDQVDGSEVIDDHIGTEAGDEGGAHGISVASDGTMTYMGEPVKAGDIAVSKERPDHMPKLWIEEIDNGDRR